MRIGLRNQVGPFFSVVSSQLSVWSVTGNRQLSISNFRKASGLNYINPPSFGPAF